MLPLTAARVVKAYAVLVAAIAFAGVAIFGVMVKRIMDGSTYTAPTYVQVFLIIPTVILFVYLCLGLFQRKEHALSVFVAILYSLVVMTLVIMGLLLLQMSMSAFVSVQFILFMLFLAFLLASIYLFDVNKDIKALFEAQPSNTPLSKA